MRVEKRRGNVFADLGLPDADILLVKADFVHRIAEAIDARKQPRVAVVA